MKQITHTLEFMTRGRGMTEFTDRIQDVVRDAGIHDGLVTVFCRHTSASLLAQENADPDVRTDLERFFARLVPDGDPLFKHRVEGPDDMPAHVRAALTQTQLSIPVQNGRLMTGTWQGIYLFEHRHAPLRREIVVHVIGE